MMHYGDMSGWGFALMGISAVVFWGLVIVGIVMLVRYFGRSGQPTTAAPTPEQLLAERFLAGEYAPETVAPQCGVDTATIRRIAAELADVAFNQAIRIPQRWTDAHGREHDEMILIRMAWAPLLTRAGRCGRQPAGRAHTRGVRRRSRPH